MQKNNQCHFARVTAALIVAALAVTDATHADAQNIAVASGVSPEGAGIAATVQTQAHVIAIDVASNSVTLRGPQGRVLDVVVNPDVGDVSKLRLGDAVNKVANDGPFVQEPKREMARPPVEDEQPSLF